jgi:hypothetical protein
MPRAKSFEHIPGFAINVLARLEAKKQVKEHLRAQGIRLTYVPAREIVAQTKRYLEAHPELYEEALQRAWEMGVCRPVNESDNLTRATEIT